ncbi:MAG: hypothetical protein ACOY33_06740 [Pseudomonadota bacterium]
MEPENREDVPESQAARATRVWEEDGFLIIEYPPGARVDLSIAHSTFRRRRELMAAAGKRRQRIIIHGSRIVSFDYDAYRFSASREVSETVIAAALVCSSALERYMSSLFVNMWKPQYPVRVFDDMASARRWLATFPEH